MDAEVGEQRPRFSLYGVVVVTTGEPPPVGGAVVEVVVVVEDELVVTTAPPPPVEGAVVVVVSQGLLRVQPLVALFLGSTPTARRASANTPTAIAPRMMLRRRLAARSPLESFDPVACSVEVMVSSVRCVF
ncbi:unannotated protein [freshwater metagenome]|uniref:Unannotated protein n=1 Tax=freshwater metagenome TaxID=449393 RepID=A0A6J7DEA8_9ZZZZ